MIEAIIDELANDAGVSAIVGARIVANQANQDEAAPHIVVSKSPGGEHTTHFGGGGGLANAVYDVTCWETEPGKEVTLAATVQEALHTFTGTMGSGGNTATVRSCVLQPEIGLVTERRGAKFGWQGMVMPFDIWHTEPVPA